MIQGRVVLPVAILWSAVATIALADTFTVTNTNDTGTGSLRQAIADANGNSGLDTITFTIPANDPRHVYYLDDGVPGEVSRFDQNGNSRLATTTEADDANIPTTGSLAIDPDWAHSWYSVQVSSALPAIAGAAVIDGYTQPGAVANSNPISMNSNSVLKIELTTVTGNEFDGLQITGGGSTVRGMAIHGFGFFIAADGIELASAGNTVEGSHIGADVSGLSGLGNQDNDVFVNNAANNLIGGIAAAARNLILFSRSGVHISGAGATGNAVQGSLIRRQVNGSGVTIDDGASQNTVGGAIPAARNVISENQFGVLISNSVVAGIPHDNFVQGNFIGTDITGTVWLPNNTGVQINSPNNVVGGLTDTPGTGPGNVIVSALYSVFISGEGSTGNRVEGNLIGTNTTGTAVPDPWGQYYTGVYVGGGGGNIVGGPNPQARNVISGTETRGAVVLQDDGSLVQNNFIGTDITGTADLGNTGGGIHVQGSNNTIRDNIIAFTKLLIEEGGEPFGSGVIVMGGTGNAILSNSIFANALLGIELQNGAVPDGLPVPNDAGDADTGPNNLQNFPVITSATTTGGATTIIGTLNSTANTTYRIEFFANNAVDPTGYGEGQSFAGSTNVTTDANGNASFNVNVPQIAGIQHVTATATDPNGNTSEFSGAIGQLLNIATRLRVQTGDNVLIGGFIITGTDPKRVIVRGIGPSLAQFFPDFLADPTLELHDGSGTILATNDNWKTRPDGSSQQAEIEATGIPPTNDLESALVRTLPANNAGYTAILRGTNNTTGIGVVEAYDLDTAANSKLANISTRGLVETGDDVLIAGFIAGNGVTKVIIRAIGPTLGNAGVPNPLQDPTLELFNGSGTSIATNDDWKTRPDGSSQQAEIEATGIQPTDDRESAIVASLPPSAYTAVVRGKNNTTGIALVEVYNLP